ncbi:hypothetical protein B0H21DRAFT_220840 [Amylocystis lapponica]|nr:hypothetical protein B0H21DRAFT_220840 [Amylocystis lapponica]
MLDLWLVPGARVIANFDLLMLKSHSPHADISRVLSDSRFTHRNVIFLSGWIDVRSRTCEQGEEVLPPAHTHFEDFSTVLPGNFVMSPHTSSVLESEQVEGPSSSPRSPQMVLPTLSRSPSPLPSAASHARPLKLSRILTTGDPVKFASPVFRSTSRVSWCESYMSDQPMSSARMLSLAQSILTLDVSASQTVCRTKNHPGSRFHI